MGPPGFFLGTGEKGFLFSGRWGALLIILDEHGSKHIFLGIKGALPKSFFFFLNIRLPFYLIL